MNPEYKIAKQESYVKGLKKKDANKLAIFARGESKLERNPYHNTEFLTGRLRGKRRLRLPQKLRTVFAICEECRKKGHIDFNRCDDCLHRDNKTVVLFFALDRAEDYKV